MKVAVIGALGQLGADVSEEFTRNNDEVVKLDVPEIDIVDIDSVNAVLKEVKPDCIINTAAYHQPEECEKNPLKAFEVNALGSKNLALVANDLDSFLLHISTDYVFNGDKKMPYFETDMPQPLNVYGNTKLSGENFIAAIAKKYMIFRTSGLYGKNPCRGKGGMNFVQLMLKLGRERDEVRVVDHEVLTPTYTKELARQLVKCSRPDIYGVAHATAECQCSWYQFAREIFEIAKIDVELNVAEPGEFPEKVARPYYSVLENNVLKEYNQNTFRNWEVGLREYLDEIL